MYRDLIDNWLNEGITGQSRELAIEVFSAVIERAKTGDPAAAAFLVSRAGWFGQSPVINVIFDDGEGEEQGNG